MSEITGASLDALLDEIVAEGNRAHLKHGDTSMRSQPWNSHRRMTIMIEELGELAEPMNDLDHGKLTEPEALDAARREAVQVAAMALDWLIAIEERITS